MHFYVTYFQSSSQHYYNGKELLIDRSVPNENIIITMTMVMTMVLIPLTVCKGHYDSLAMSNVHEGGRRKQVGCGL